MKILARLLTASTGLLGLNILNKTKTAYCIDEVGDGFCHSVYLPPPTKAQKIEAEVFKIKSRYLELSTCHASFMRCIDTVSENSGKKDCINEHARCVEKPNVLGFPKLN